MDFVDFMRFHEISWIPRTEDLVAFANEVLPLESVAACLNDVLPLEIFLHDLSCLLLHRFS